MRRLSSVYQIPLVPSQLGSKFRFHQTHKFMPKQITIKRGNGFGDLVLGTLTASQTILDYPAKPVSSAEFKRLVDIAKQGSAISVKTDIGKEVFHKSPKKTHIIFCEFQSDSRPMAATDVVSKKIYFHADCLKDNEFLTRAAIIYQFSRTDIHEHVHALQYSSGALFSSEIEMSKLYPKFKREGTLVPRNFADRLYSETHAHYIERLHLYQLKKLGDSFSPKSQNTEFSMYMDEGLKDKAFLSVLFYLIKHQGYKFDVPFLTGIYNKGYDRNKTLSISDRELEGAREILAQFSTIKNISDNNPQLLSEHEYAFLFEPMSEYGPYEEPFFDVVGATTLKK